MFDVMQLTTDHPEKEQMFYLVKMLEESEYPFFFNFYEDMSPTPFNPEGGVPETDIDWQQYNFLIEIGHPAGHNLSQLSITFNHEGDKTLLEVLDMRPAEDNPNATAEDGILTPDLKAEDVMEIIEKYFDTI